MDLHSGTPFWPVRDGLLATYPSLQRYAAADVAIVGAGITGALVAHALTLDGADVIVIDRHDVVSGSSAATSGLLLYDTDSSLSELTDAVGAAGAARVYQLGLAAVDTIEALVASLGHPCGFARRPSLYLASRRRHVPALRDEHQRRAHLGLDVSLLEARDVTAQYSFTAPAAIRSQGTAEIDCYRFAHELLADAKRRGARIYDRTEVTAIDAQRDGVRLTIDGRHTVTAKQVICATGYDVSVKLRRSPGRLASTWAFVSEPIDAFPGWPERCLIWETSRPYLYLRTTEDGRVLAGGEDEPFPYRHRRRTTFVAKTERLVRRVRAMFPDLHIEPAYCWAGTFATTADGLPLIGQVPDHPCVWFALGYGGNGITFSVIAARILRDLLQGRDNSDASLFSFDRQT